MSRNDFRYSSLCSCGLSSWAQRLRTCSGVHTGGTERLPHRQRANSARAAGCRGSSTPSRPPRWSLHQQLRHTGSDMWREWALLTTAAAVWARAGGGRRRVLCCGPVFRAGGGHSSPKRCAAASTIRGFFSRTERKVQYRGSGICSICVEYDSARGCGGKESGGWWGVGGAGGASTGVLQRGLRAASHRTVSAALPAPSSQPFRATKRPRRPAAAHFDRPAAPGLPAAVAGHGSAVVARRCPTPLPRPAGAASRAGPIQLTGAPIQLTGGAMP